LRNRTGAFTTFDVPGGPLSTIPVALNLEGSVVGSVLDANSVWHGFVRGSDGSFTTIDGPSACNSTWFDNCAGTGALSINAFGEISGSYSDNNVVFHGLVLSPKGVLTTLDAPGAGTTSGQGTSCPDCSAPLNQFGVIAGYYTDGSDVVHGFLRSPAGKITTFDAPAGAGSQGFGCWQECPLGLNDSGEVTGVYADASGVYHGFLRSPWGKITTFDAPGAANGTLPVSINDRGAIAGFYLDANNVYHAFLRLPADD
jgi:hypothetical protein